MVVNNMPPLVSNLSCYNLFKLWLNLLYMVLTSAAKNLVFKKKLSL